MAGQVFQALIAGVKKWVTSIQTSAGAGDAGKIPALNSVGKIDITMLPGGLANTITAPASESLVAGNAVNVWSNSGTLNVRKADATSAAKRAHGFIIANYSTSDSVTVYCDGQLTGLSGLTVGSEYYLSTTPGAVTTDPSGYTSSGNLIQHVGVCETASILHLGIDTDPAQIQ